MSRYIIYIINPVSGTSSKKQLENLIIRKTKEAGILFDIRYSVADADYSFLLPEIKAKNITDIVIAGGDGTVSQVVGNLMHTGLNFGIIPCGSGNGLSNAAKIPINPAQALDNIFNGHPSPIDGFYVNDRFACMLCGLGFDAKVAHDFARQPRRGLATYVKQVFRNFFSAHSYPFEMEINGEKFHTDAYFISIANSNQFGNHFTIAPEASLNDGLLDIVIVTNQNKLSLLIQTFRQVKGKNRVQQTAVIEKKRAVIYLQAEGLRIGNPSRAPMHIDGDPASTSNVVTAEIRKKCFNLIQPIK